MFSVRRPLNYITKEQTDLLNKNKKNIPCSKVESPSESSDMRKLLKGLDQKTPSDYKIVNGKRVYSQISKDKVNGFLQLAGAAIDKEVETIKNKPLYRYKEVSSKIRSAKTAVSAGQALLAAKKNVMEIKRALSSKSNKENAKELLISLSHAKRMEIAAKKKKKHLETEELIENTKKLDDKLETIEDAFSEQEIRSTIIEESENKIEDMEDNILEEREALYDEMSDSIEENEDISDELISELANTLAEFGEEELKQLEENMEMLESMEVINPHMSDEDFKKLKTKHRASEEKTIVKADMEYLKDIMKLVEDNGGGVFTECNTFSFEAAV